VGNPAEGTVNVSWYAKDYLVTTEKVEGLHMQIQEELENENEWSTEQSARCA
jgi:hypothetical protein